MPRRLSGPVLRWYKALGTQAFYHLSRRRPGFVRGLLRRQAERQLPFGYDVDTHFTPRHDPWDQRLCVAPDGDFFRAIKAGPAVSVVTDTVAHAIPPRTVCSSARAPSSAADVVVTATGLEVQFLGGIELAVDGSPVDPASRLIYKGVMLEGVPNLAVAFGYANASWTLKCDLTGAYLCRLLNHMRATGQRQCLPMNRDGDVFGTRPLLGLRSGYVLRSEDRLPKQGSKFPWQVNQSYFRDYRILQRGELEDDVLVFTNPPAPVRGRGSPFPGKSTRRMRSFNGRVAAITGAGSGIGRALAEQLAIRGARLALSDIDEKGLAETATRCSVQAVKVTSARVDVASRDEVYAWADRVRDDHGTVNMIFNNAGVALGRHRRGHGL